MKTDPTFKSDLYELCSIWQDYHKNGYDVMAVIYKEIRTFHFSIHLTLSVLKETVKYSYVKITFPWN